VIHDAPDGLYRWRLLAPGGRLVALSPDAYETPGDARRAADTVRANAGWAEVEHRLPSHAPIKARGARTLRHVAGRVRRGT
jgi:uncharacterized protein YegP (UPF0339 family)